MTRHAFSTVLFLLVTTGFSLIFFFEWRHGRIDNDLSTGTILQAIQRQGNATSAQSQLLTSYNETLRGILSQLHVQEDLLSRLIRNVGPSAQQEPAASAVQGTDSPVETDESERELAYLEALERIPAGINPVPYVSTVTLQELVQDERFNPTRKSLGPTDLLELNRIMVAARAALEVLRAETAVEASRGAATLRETGDFFNYSPGERIENPEGLITLREPLGDDLARVYYFLAEEFPDLYRKRQVENKMIATIAVTDLRKYIEDVR